MINIKVKQKKASFKRKRDNYASRLKRKELIKFLRSQLLTCTTHGLNYSVDDDTHWCERLFWRISFMSCVVLIYILLSAQYARFASAPIVMSVEMDYSDWKVPYPAITICPEYNEDEDSLNAFVTETFERTGQNITAYLKALASASLDSIEKLHIPETNIIPLIHMRDYAGVAALLFKQMDNSSLTTNTNWPVTVEPAMTELGMCHVINSNVAIYDNPTKWSDSGLVYAKKNIELSIHDREFFAQIMNYADIYKAYIHSPDEVVLTSTPSYTFNITGFLSLGVRVWSTRISNDLRSMPLHHRRCRFINEPISERYPVYSYNHCLLECRIQMILKLCHCVPHFYKHLDHERICNLKQLSCVIKYKKEIITLSASTETLRNFRNSGSLPKSARDCGCLSSCDTDIYRKDREYLITGTSLNRLRIGISTFPKLRALRENVFTLYDIILKSGGVVNLCIGSSFISMMEFIVTALKIIRIIIKGLIEVYVLPYIVGN